MRGRLRIGVLSAISAAALGTAAPSTPPAMAQGLPPVSLSGPTGVPLAPLAGGTSPLGSLGSGAGALAGFELSAVSNWVLGGAKAALQETARIIARTTAPHLESTWFSSTYWRVARLGALLTLPFLFAAAGQALLRSDLALLMRAAFGYLPVALIGVSLAAPLAMLLLAGTDEMCSVVARAGAGGGVHFLTQTGIAIVGLGAVSGSPFLAFAIGLFTLGAALALTIELLVREAAVYVVVLMLPMAFAGLVWPARRVWAVRTVELLVALILSKFVIVAVLSLAGAAYGSSGAPTVTRLLMAMALLMLATLAPWVMLRLLPFTELAAGAAGALRAELPRLPGARDLMPAADGGASRIEALAARVRRTTDGFDGTPLTARRSQARRGETAEASPPQSDSALPDPVASDPIPPEPAAPDPVPSEPAANGPAAARPERLPGMGAIWQAEDYAWPPFVLGPGGWGGLTEYVPPETSGPPEASPNGQGVADPPLAADPDSSSLDPLPPLQPRDGSILARPDGEAPA